MGRLLKRVAVGAVLAALVILLDKFVLSDTTEAFDGGARLGDAFYWLAIAYLSSAIFFVLVVAMPWYENDHRIYARVGPLTSQVRGAFLRTMDELVRQAKMPEPVPAVPLSQDEMAAVCARVDPRGEANMVKSGPPDFIHATVLEYMIDAYLVTEERIGQIFVLMPHLDVELIALLNGIQQCSHWQTMSFVSRHPIGNADLSHFCAGLLDYQMAAMRLSEYLDKRADNAKR